MHVKDRLEEQVFVGVQHSHDTQQPNGTAPLERSKRHRAVLAKEIGKANCGSECINRQSLVHCDSKTCPCGALCSNRHFSDPFHASLHHGLFAFSNLGMHSHLHFS